MDYGGITPVDVCKHAVGGVGASGIGDIGVKISRFQKKS